MPVIQANRAKLSTTVSIETYKYLEEKLNAGEASSLAEVLDNLVLKVRKLENRERLARATTRYFEQIPEGSVKEESNLATDLSTAHSGVDFDNEF